MRHTLRIAVIFIVTASALTGCQSQHLSHSTAPLDQKVNTKAAEPFASLVHEDIEILPCQPWSMGMYGDPNGVELVDVDPDYQPPEFAPLGAAQILAIDSKYYALAYGVSHTEAMRQMLIQHDNSAATEEIRAEFGDKITAIGLTTEPEYGMVVILKDVETAPPMRRMYRDAKPLAERKIVAASFATPNDRGVTLTQAEVDTATALITSPTAFIVRFELEKDLLPLPEPEYRLCTNP